MTGTVEKLAREVESLPADQLDEFLGWLAEFESRRLDEWDAAIARDSGTGGRLRDALERAEQDIAAGRTEPLDELLNDG
ncbi:MAG TPA: hypothetical protein ENN51_05085 [candidate division WOR-3 bacterium]|uniref:DUF2281 domain-containing protein n=1 Tax=candidate division WOR-3 bacterium TaxID=2052148 RepID=A0A7V0T657_UNCW3|nr:hypothetical protein [candidate division WOR-3 bacterium]